MSHTHSDEPGEGGGWRLLVALALNVGIVIAQVIGAVVSGSLALAADAAHNASDAGALAVSYVAKRISRRAPDHRRTFGYARAETIGALLNLTVLFVIAGYLAYQGVRRLIEPSEVAGTTMLIVGVIAFVEDLLSVLVLRKSAKGSLNVRSAMIHLIGDTMSTVGVIVGALLIRAYGITWVDPAITIGIAVYIAIHGYVEIRKAIRILMESVPEGFDLDAMVRAMEAIDGVDSVRHVHVWKLDETRTAAEAHVSVRAERLGEIEQIKSRVRQALNDDFEVAHATLEVSRADANARACSDRAT
jgi:cobalt-zinc-cadmium efflux system protein